MRPAVRAAVEPLLFGAPEPLGNPSSIHWAGRQAKRHLEAARRRVALHFDRKPSEVIFTSGGSEADNLALRGVLHCGGRLALSTVEHPAVRNTAAALHDVPVFVIGVDGEGRLDLDALDRALSRGVDLVSVMAVNNETGVVHDIDAVVARAHAAGVRVHVDAVQSVGRLPPPSAADLISISGHKLGGLPGAGALIIRQGLPLAPMITGGAQERGRRAGTEPVAAIVALAEALDAAQASRAAEATRLAPLTGKLERALQALDGVRILGAGATRVPGVSTALFEGVEGESLLIALDLAGVAASTGSACASGSLEPSHVLLAMGVPSGEALAAVRFSMGWATTEAEVDAVIAVLPTLLEQVRAGA